MSVYEPPAYYQALIESLSEYFNPKNKFGLRHGVSGVGPDIDEEAIQAAASEFCMSLDPEEIHTVSHALNIQGCPHSPRHRREVELLLHRKQKDCPALARLLTQLEVEVDAELNLVPQPDKEA